MTSVRDMIASADWKKEKHVPVIEAKETIKKGEMLDVTLSIGKEIAHPNTTEHHISWVSVYFLADGEKFSYHLLRAEFTAHGAAVAGPNTSGIYTHPVVKVSLKLEKSGTLMAVSYCNIHGLWESSKKITVE